jgi:hypothetical protein
MPKQTSRRAPTAVNPHVASLVGKTPLGATRNVTEPSPPSFPWKDAHVSPAACLGTPEQWEGPSAIKPWHYRVTAVVPHCETPELLKACLDLLRLQTVKPYILLIDTGTRAEELGAVEAHRADDCEVHFIRSHGYRHSSGPVGVAQDLAAALCRTEYLFCTHADCFLRRRDFLDWELALCSANRPVVGYQMSPRDWITDDWKGMVSHTATMLHMPTLYSAGVTWSFERAHYQFGVDRTRACWPDTETGFNLALRAAGIEPHLIGDETNFERFVDRNLDHPRSYPGAKILRHELFPTAEAWMKEALREAQDRANSWREQIAAGGQLPTI